MRYRILPAVKTGVVMFFPWFLAPLIALSEIYPAVIVTFAAILYTVTIKDEPNSRLHRISALVGTALGVILGLFASNLIGKKEFLGDLFKVCFYLTALEMLTILLTNDAASVVWTVRKRKEKAREKVALSQRSPAAVIVISALCALAASAFPIVLLLLQNAFGFSTSQQYQEYLLDAECFFLPPLIVSLYFRLLPKVHKWYIPVSFFIAGITGMIIKWVMIQNVLLQTEGSAVTYYLNGRSYALAAGFIVFTIVPLADLVILSRYKE